MITIFTSSHKIYSLRNESFKNGFTWRAAPLRTMPIKRKVEGAPAATTPMKRKAEHASLYTDAVAKDEYLTLQQVLDAKMANADLRSVISTMFDACATIAGMLREELVTVADKQASVFGDVQLGVDMLADQLLWDTCRNEPLIKTAASEEEPEVREMHAQGQFCICWDPLDGSSIVDNNWAVGTIIGVWPSATGIIGATGRDQVASLVANYGPRTTVYVTLDDGVYEFTHGAKGAGGGWLCSRDGADVRIQANSKVFAPANLRATQELPSYGELVHYWTANRYTLRYTGGLVPDVCQQFTKRQGVFANPSSPSSPAKLRLAFEAAPLGLLVERAGGKTSDGVSGGSILDVPIYAIDQRSPICLGSSNEVDRFNATVLSCNVEPVPAQASAV